MTQNEFDVLSNDLRTVAREIPLNWGHIQNNIYDNELKKVCNIFNIKTLSELNRYISQFDNDHQVYYKHRWYLLRCADCDEFLFYKNDNTEHNPDRFDKKWDIKICNRFLFDVKGTVIPKSFRNQWDDVIENPQQIIDFYYERQSKGVRYDMQNRLFIVHHSLVDENREFFLRCAWKTKEFVYKIFVDNIEKIKLNKYDKCDVAIIFIIETALNELQYKIVGFNTELESLIK